MKIDIEDDGWIDVGLPGGGTVRLDACVASDLLGRAVRAGGDDTEAQAREMREALLRYGIDGLSYKAMFALANACFEKAEDVLKKVGTTRPSSGGTGSPASTASAPTSTPTERP